MEFGLDRFELAQRHALQGQPGTQLGQSGHVGLGNIDVEGQGSGRLAYNVGNPIIDLPVGDGLHP